MLLHPDFTGDRQLGPDLDTGRHDDGVGGAPRGPVELELLGADRLGGTRILLTYRSYTRSGTALRSSLWVLDGAQWRLRFHQGTPEA